MRSRSSPQRETEGSRERAGCHCSRIGTITTQAAAPILVCGVGARRIRDRALFGWLRRVAATTRRLGSVCVGGFLLAEAGILDGRRATAHWRYARELADRYPRVAVDPRPTWVQDGNIYTSAGISAGIDLALAWVEEDFGTAAALKVARELVLFLRRPGGQDHIYARTRGARTRGNRSLWSRLGSRALLLQPLTERDHRERNLSAPCSACSTVASRRGHARPALRSPARTSSAQTTSRRRHRR